jgi:2-(1,2-epoxy-1,2-dihydrophenyl)acetyl-CoA isomerase
LNSPTLINQQLSDPVLVAHEGSITRITLNKPKKKNALTVEEMGSIACAMQAAVTAGSRAICITGAGGSFCAGRDLSGVDPATDETLKVLQDLIAPVLEAVRHCPLPTVACVQGPALGFGFGLALACDVVYASETALLGSPFRSIGLTMDSGGHYYLRERLGRAQAAELIFTGKLFSGLEAARWGLINRAVPAPTVVDACDELLYKIASGPTQAFAATKRILDEGHTYEQVCALEAQCQAELMATEDAVEGLAAFNQKRKPKFVGR